MSRIYQLHIHPNAIQRFHNCFRFIFSHKTIINMDTFYSIISNRLKTQRRQNTRVNATRNQNQYFTGWSNLFLNFFDTSDISGFWGKITGKTG